MIEESVTSQYQGNTVVSMVAKTPVGGQASSGLSGNWKEHPSDYACKRE